MYVYTVKRVTLQATYTIAVKFIAVVTGARVDVIRAAMLTVRHTRAGERARAIRLQQNTTI